MAWRPKVSVVMPVRNEAAFISQSLGAVLEQDYPADLIEVIVADGMSTDETRDVVGSLAVRSATSVQIVDNPGMTAPTGMNAGIGAARGEVIVRVDGHCVIARDYVRRCVDALERTGADNVGGAQCAVGSSLVGRAIAAAFASPFGSGNADYRHAGRGGWVETVYLGAFRREVFDRIGMFDPELTRTQDAELNLRLVQSGGRIWLDPEIHVTYHGRGSVRTLWRQYFEYGVYKVRLMQKRGSLAALRQAIPPLFVVAAGAGLVTAAASRRPLFAGIPLGPYAVANLAASAHAARKDPALFVLLPLVFAVMHVAWGAGFLTGLWRWRSHFRRSL